jgi:hypothetical protein
LGRKGDNLAQKAEQQREKRYVVFHTSGFVLGKKLGTKIKVNLTFFLEKGFCWRKRQEDV